MAGAVVDAGRADRLEGGGWLEPRGAQIEFAFLWRWREFEGSKSESLGHPLGHMFLLFGIRSLILVTPSPEFSLALLCHTNVPRIGRRDQNSPTAPILRLTLLRGQTRIGACLDRDGVVTVKSSAQIIRASPHT